MSQQSPRLKSLYMMDLPPLERLIAEVRARHGDDKPLTIAMIEAHVRHRYTNYERVLNGKRDDAYMALRRRVMGLIRHRLATRYQPGELASVLTET